MKNDGNDMKKISKKRNTFNTLLKESEGFVYFICCLCVIGYYGLITFILNLIGVLDNTANLADAILSVFLVGLLPIPSLAIVYGLYCIFKSGFSHIRAILNYTRLPLTTEELKAGVAFDAFANMEDYLQYIGGKLEYKIGFDLQSIQINLKDVYQILRSVKDVFHEDKIVLFAATKKESSIEGKKDIFAHFWSFMDTITPFSDMLSYSFSYFESNFYSISIELDSVKDRTVLFRLTPRSDCKDVVIIRIGLDSEEEDKVLSSRIGVE